MNYNNLILMRTCEIALNHAQHLTESELSEVRTAYMKSLRRFFDGTPIMEQAKKAIDKAVRYDLPEAFVNELRMDYLTGF